MADLGADFQPHITITSSIPATLLPTAQSVLTSIPLPSPAPTIIFKRLRYGTAFFTKITIEIHKSTTLKNLAIACRSALVPDVDYAKAEEWSEKYTTPAESGEEGFIPHLSLVYWGGDLVTDVTGENDAVKMGVRSDVYEAGIKFNETVEGVFEEVEIGDLGGWRGGKLVIVDTQGKIEDWKVLAEREL
ncbi:hypothetical protein ABW19_dt0208993 [Dactylella cylindrospora]|nr:hypothetical protein ABW19_dt0208993 [Dactylella cylindrospora]